MKYKNFLRIESFFIFLFLVILYHNFELSWKLFFIFILSPDIFMLGYIMGPKVGAALYNLSHNYAVSVILIVFAMATNSQLLATISAIWALHISGDRMLGFGLKIEDGFKHTHLS